jgi:hypothetical protein
LDGFIQSPKPSPWAGRVSASMLAVASAAAVMVVFSPLFIVLLQR